ncbi:MAG: hypothetical protein FWF05_05750 [Oscillospiraceae bacterium]|nr:hypothetical protein [Oscillospiraceae bacterium]
MKKTEAVREKKQYLLKLSENAELCKGVLLVCAGYIFCYMFMLDYSDPEMNIFHRWSTTSRTMFAHPVLFIIWGILCALTFFLNLDYLRRRYGLGHMKSLAILQYIGLISLVLTFTVPVPSTFPPYEVFFDEFRFRLHQLTSALYGVVNVVCLFLIIAKNAREDKRFKKFFWGAIVYMILLVAGIILMLSGFMETAPTLVAMAVIYVLNFTKVTVPNKT